MDQSLGKNEKLKSKKLIECLFSEGKAVKKFPLKLVYLPLSSPQANCHKTGVTVPKKFMKSAVQRNGIKRLMREAFRKNKYLVDSASLPNYGFMFIYLSRDEMGYEQMNKTMILLLEKFKQKEKEHEKSSH